MLCCAQKRSKIRYRNGSSCQMSPRADSSRVKSQQLHSGAFTTDASAGVSVRRARKNWRDICRKVGEKKSITEKRLFEIVVKHGIEWLVYFSPVISCYAVRVRPCSTPHAPQPYNNFCWSWDWALPSDWISVWAGRRNGILRGKPEPHCQEVQN